MSDVVGKTWPDLSSDSLQPTIEARRLFAQVVGKVRIGLTPWVNHSWHAPLYVSARGLTPGWIPADPGALDLESDLVGEALVSRSADAEEGRVDLGGESVASFYAKKIPAMAARPRAFDHAMAPAG